MTKETILNARKALKDLYLKAELSINGSDAFLAGICKDYLQITIALDGADDLIKTPEENK